VCYTNVTKTKMTVLKRIYFMAVINGMFCLDARDI